MSSNNETRHSKNVANFRKLISFCTSFGAAYDPPKSALRLSSLNAIRTQAESKLEAVKVSEKTLDNLIKARQIAFKPLRPIVTKVIKALPASGLGDPVIAEVKTIVRKIRTLKTKPSDTPLSQTAAITAPTPNNKMSLLQLSYDNQINYFAKLVRLLSQHAEYNPGNPKLSIAELNILLNDMLAINAGVVNAHTGWSNTSIEINKSIHDPLAGMLQTSREIKLYLSSR